MHAILLTLKLLRMLPFFAIVYLESIVVACYDRELARVVEVEGGDGRGAKRWLEALDIISMTVMGRIAGVQ